MSFSFPTVAKTFHHWSAPYQAEGHSLHMGQCNAWSKRCCRHCPQTSTFRLADFSSNTAVSSFTAASRCFRPGLLPLQLALGLQTTTKRGDNHFKFHIQTAESTEIECCVLHSSEKFCLFFFFLEGLINIGINPQLLAQGPDHRFVHSYLTMCWSTEDSFFPPIPSCLG